MPTVIMHDTRLRGDPEPGLGTVVTVNGSTPLATGFTEVISAASESETELVIACHGYMTHDYGNMTNIESRGGQGLQLCRESLLVENVNRSSVLRDHFTRIWLMACGPAGTVVDPSRPFCRELARHTNAEVIASDASQSYYPGDCDAVARICQEVLRFGNWEGNVYVFSPDGSVTDFTSGETPLP